MGDVPLITSGHYAHTSTTVQRFMWCCGFVLRTSCRFRSHQIIIKTSAAILNSPSRMQTWMSAPAPLVLTAWRRIVNGGVSLCAEQLTDALAGLASFFCPAVFFLRRSHWQLYHLMRSDFIKEGPLTTFPRSFNANASISRTGWQQIGAVAYRKKKKEKGGKKTGRSRS